MLPQHEALQLVAPLADVFIDRLSRAPHYEHTDIPNVSVYAVRYAFDAKTFCTLDDLSKTVGLAFLTIVERKRKPPFVYGVVLGSPHDVRRTLPDGAELHALDRRSVSYALRSALFEPIFRGRQRLHEVKARANVSLDDVVISPALTDAWNAVRADVYIAFGNTTGSKLDAKACPYCRKHPLTQRKNGGHTCGAPACKMKRYRKMKVAKRSAEGIGNVET